MIRQESARREKNLKDARVQSMIKLKKFSRSASADNSCISVLNKSSNFSYAVKTLHEELNNLSIAIA